MKKLFQFVQMAVIAGLLAFAVPRVHYGMLRHYVADKVVAVTNEAATGGGTGFYVEAPSGNIYIMTNAHVCNGVDPAGKTVFINKKPHKILEIGDTEDLCLVEAEPHSALKLATKESFHEIVYVVGHPLLMPNTMSMGELIGKWKIEVMDHFLNGPEDKCEGPNRRIQKIRMFIFEVEACVIAYEATHSNVVILPGNSGSPLVNKYGNIIGVAFAGNQRSNWGSFMSLEAVKKFLKKY